MNVTDTLLAADGSIWGREVTAADGSMAAQFAYLDGTTWERTLYTDGIPTVDVVASLDDYPDPRAAAIEAVAAAVESLAGLPADDPTRVAVEALAAAITGKAP